LRSGRLVWSLPMEEGGFGGFFEPGLVGIRPRMDLVLKPNGAVAWVTPGKYLLRCEEEACSPPLELRVADRRGARTIAKSRRIGFDSLTLHGDTVGWLEGHRRRTARIE